MQTANIDKPTPGRRLTCSVCTRAGRRHLESVFTYKIKKFLQDGNCWNFCLWFSFLVKAQQSTNYRQNISLDTTPDRWLQYFILPLYFNGTTVISSHAYNECWAKLEDKKNNCFMYSKVENSVFGLWQKISFVIFICQKSSTQIYTEQAASRFLWSRCLEMRDI